jgi:hypothetical protein
MHDPYGFLKRHDPYGFLIYPTLGTRPMRSLGYLIMHKALTGFLKMHDPYGFLKRHDPYGFLKRHDPTLGSAYFFLIMEILGSYLMEHKYFPPQGKKYIDQYIF